MKIHEMLATVVGLALASAIVAGLATIFHGDFFAWFLWTFIILCIALILILRAK